MRRQVPIRRPKGENGFTLTEMLIAMVVVIFGLVAVAQLVPSSVMMSSTGALPRQYSPRPPWPQRLPSSGLA